MSKGLEALEVIGNINLGKNPYVRFDEDLIKNCMDEEYNIIEKELNRLKELEKAINKEYTHWKRIKYNDEMNGHSNNTADYCVEFLSFLKEVLDNDKC